MWFNKALDILEGSSGRAAQSELSGVGQKWLIPYIPALISRQMWAAPVRVIVWASGS